MYFVSHGVVDPEALAMLREALDAWSEEHPDGNRTKAASTLLWAYQSGKRTRQDLLSALQGSL